jgi:hypothetical protein
MIKLGSPEINLVYQGLCSQYFSIVFCLGLESFMLDSWDPKVNLESRG